MQYVMKTTNSAMKKEKSVNMFTQANSMQARSHQFAVSRSTAVNLGGGGTSSNLKINSVQIEVKTSSNEYMHLLNALCLALAAPANKLHHEKQKSGFLKN